MLDTPEFLDPNETGRDRNRAAVAATFLACLLGIPAGIVAAVKPYTTLDVIVTALAFFGMSMPAFWLGLMLIIIFSVKLKLLPVGGSGGFVYLILPSITLAAALVAGTGFALFAIAEGPAVVRQAVRIAPQKIAVGGLGLALAAVALTASTTGAKDCTYTFPAQGGTKATLEKGEVACGGLGNLRGQPLYLTGENQRWEGANALEHCMIRRGVCV